MILLSETEIDKILGMKHANAYTTICKRVAKAQLRAVVEWLGKYRSETTRDFAGFTMSKDTWQAILKEVE